ncbi:MAG: hypothetical protein HZA66_08380 [Rhodopseudomonas palustris]|uniref:Uncharacterized protein n=1 Tax=Rhodopseudomonas palustris TaxID=1076 RepID=A0A933RVK0_RHOPL|nr:hypothetical protein [Rhodopseudomonas palustris]
MTSSKLPDSELFARPATPNARPTTSASDKSTEDRPQVVPQNQLTDQAPRNVDASPRGTASAAGSTPAVTNPRSASEIPPASAATPNGVASAADERAEILKRIAAFRNLQVRLRQDREKYYDETLARTRSLLSQPMKPRR